MCQLSCCLSLEVCTEYATIVTYCDQYLRISTDYVRCACVAASSPIGSRGKSWQTWGTTHQRIALLVQQEMTLGACLGAWNLDEFGGNMGKLMGHSKVE